MKTISENDENRLHHGIAKKEGLMKCFQISRWLASDMAGTLAGSDREALDKWLAESEANRETYREFKQDFLCGKGMGPYSDEEVEHQLSLFYRHRTRSRRIPFYYYAVASVVLLVIGFSVLLYWGMRRDYSLPDTSPASIQVAQGQVMLELSSGERVGLVDSIHFEIKEPSGNIWVSGEELCYRERDTLLCEEVYNTLLVPRGAEYKVSLADGTLVWLNSESELRYPVRLSGNRRTVYLKGEGYFVVAPDKDRPFTVSTGDDVDVRVLGTKFNVSAYAGDEEIVTTLAEGSVEIVMYGDSTRMQPDEQVVFNKKEKTFYRGEVDASVYSAWKDGKFIFEDQPLERIMERLKRWYDMEVFYANDEVREYRLTGDLKKYENFEQAVRMIEEVADLEVDINNKCVIISARQ